MGGLRKKMPVTFWTFMVGTLALSGVPPFSGFYSQGLAFSRRRWNRQNYLLVRRRGLSWRP